MKKLIALSLSASMMLAAAGPAFAGGWPHFTAANSAVVGGNSVVSSANTGYNTQGATVGTIGSNSWWGGTTGVVGGGSHQELITGHALSEAGSTVSVDQSNCGCLSWFKTNEAVVTGNTVTSSANTGFNTQGATLTTTGTSGFHGVTTVLGGGSVQLFQTGNAGSQGWSVVNVSQ